tara:strand:+ start:9192 stop:11141 length:1950 start_codon:yes stop_codon:yes gene_type:complete
VIEMIYTSVVPIGGIFTDELIEHGVECGLFNIPPIQRQYQWGPGHDEIADQNRSARELIEDLINFWRFNMDNEDPYFTGTMIIYKEEGDDEGVYHLMDGQQRWTTFTALMGTIHHLLDGDQTGVDHIDTMEEIKRCFLQSMANDYRLTSHRGFDDDLIRRLSNYGGEVDLQEYEYQAEENEVVPNSVYKVEETQYQGTDLLCVASYFLDQLRNTFAIEGPFSSRDMLLDFYQTIRDRVFVNLTLAPTSSVAYEMFITANARGTPLNNFDIFRGLVISRERDLPGDNAELLRLLLQNGQARLDRYCSFSPRSDASKLIDKIMSEVTGVIEGQRIQTNNVMVFLKARINGVESVTELVRLSTLILHYVGLHVRINNRNERGALHPHRRLQYMGFTGYYPLYIIAHMDVNEEEDHEIWEAKEDRFDALMNTVECFVSRVGLTAHNNLRPAALAFYTLAYQQANYIYEDGLTEEVLIRIQREYSEHDANPEDLNALRVKTFEIPSNKKQYFLTSVFYAVENIVQHPVRRGEGANGVRKILPLMPTYDPSAWQTIAYWAYGAEAEGTQLFSRQIGNLFPLTGQVGQLRELDDDTIAIIARITAFRNHSAGMVTLTDPFIANNQWTFNHIVARGNALIKILTERFPHNCVVEIEE